MNALKLASSVGPAILVLVLATTTPARGQDAPSTPDTPGGAGSHSPPSPAAGSAPGEGRPSPAPTAAPSPAPSPGANEPRGLWLGSREDTVAEASLELYYADFKSRSHFGFKEHNGRGEETAFVQDCGWPGAVLMEGAAIRLNLGMAGWIGADVLGFGVSNERGFLSRERQTNSVFFEPGDTLHSHGQILWGRVYYGYELGYRLELGGIPIALAASPYLGLGAIDEDIRVRRAGSNPTSWLGGHILAFNVVPGLRGYVDFFDHVKVGYDVGIPVALPLTTPQVHTNERYGFYLGLHAWHVELDIGWKLVANHLLGIERATDMRFRGYDFQLTVTF